MSAFYSRTWDMRNIITQLPESGDLCGNITEFGVVK